MVFTTRNGISIDTEKDLTAPERHILQKLFIWETMASSMDQFRQKKKEAMLRGWNDSGPVRGSKAMEVILAELEERVAARLSQGLPPTTSGG